MHAIGKVLGHPCPPAPSPSFPSHFLPSTPPAWSPTPHPPPPFPPSPPSVSLLPAGLAGRPRSVFTSRVRCTLSLEPEPTAVGVDDPPTTSPSPPLAGYCNVQRSVFGRLETPDESFRLAGPSAGVLWLKKITGLRIITGEGHREPGHRASRRAVAEGQRRTAVTVRVGTPQNPRPGGGQRVPGCQAKEKPELVG